MNNHVDLRKLLEGWPYDPDDNVRVLQGTDGREIMQVRLPVGIEQYELEGRPDGQQPYGMETALEYHRAQLARAKEGGKEASFKLSPDECAELFNEGVLYYYRYLHCFHVKDWKRTVRDTARNLTLFDFVHRFARREEDRTHLEQWRPYLIRMNAVARAMLELEEGRHDQALRVVREAAERLESLPPLDDPTFKFEQKRSLQALQELIAQIEKSRPVPEVELLERELQQAVDAEEYERAAGLRDRIRNLRKKSAAR